MASVALVALALAGCSGPSNSPSDETIETTVSYPIPDGCPTGDEFGKVWQGESAEAVDLATLNAQLLTPVPDGGCAYVQGEQKTNSTTGEQYRELVVFYFNINQPSMITDQQLLDWAVGVGGTQPECVEHDSAGNCLFEWDGNSYDLPSGVLTNWTNAYLAVVGGASRLNWEDEDLIPQWTQGETGRIEFAMNADAAEALVGGTSQSDPTTALASGLAATGSAQFSVTNTQSYTASLDVDSQVQPFTSDVLNAPPGQFEISSNARVSGSVTNTTEGRQTVAPGVSVILVYSLDSAVCANSANVIATASETSDSASYCRVGAGALPESTLAPDATSALGPAGSNESLGLFPEDAALLAAFNAPVSMYVSLGKEWGAMGVGSSQLDWTADKGCKTQVKYGLQWVVAMEGWPDVLCEG